jgi:hypothetical protein
LFTRKQYAGGDLRRNEDQSESSPGLAPHAAQLLGKSGNSSTTSLRMSLRVES